MSFKTLSWNQMSDLGLMERINREILHKYGLAMTRNPDNGFSESVLISDDGIFEYSKSLKQKDIYSDDEIRNKIERLAK